MMALRYYTTEVCNFGPTITASYYISEYNNAVGRNSTWKTIEL
jgi:hypothetical protein